MHVGHHFLVSSPDSLFVFGWGGSLVDQANIFVPALECRSQVLVCRFGSVRYMNLINTIIMNNYHYNCFGMAIDSKALCSVVLWTYQCHRRLKLLSGI